MALRLTCPCGYRTYGRDDTELVANARGHLTEQHPGRNYGSEEILAMATSIPDALLPDE